ncbi:PIN domain-containing protein [Fulvivirga kasyanovii]|uniref:PIN domain-containing protein n=1 Tax=Fulvivirga kasyanovii TaxID=396812 RepID=A0ABW9RTK6_9BACT|nr:PIN domain-containing protein [Fulvivirga kasyanovii]MTI27391.1 PIN domain-containing protein [Fulvivirga kasyanovii]
MIHSPRFAVVLDACVLYPAPVRDILLSMAAEGLFKPKWTKEIQDEWVRNLLKRRDDLKEEVLFKTVRAMNLAFPDAAVENYEDLIEGLRLPDKDDRHVVAAAIKCNADLIVTNNLKDFPGTIVEKYDLEIQSPDELVSNLIQLNKKLSCVAFNKMVNRLKNPPKTKREVAQSLRNCGLSKSSEMLLSLC